MSHVSRPFTPGGPPLLTHVLVRLEIHPDLLPPWLHPGESVSLPVPAIYPCEAQGEPLLSFLAAGAVYPAIVRREAEIFFCFDYLETLEFVRLERYCRVRRPWASYVPFGYRHVPIAARRLVATLLTMAKRLSRGSGFPAFPLEKALHTLTYVVGRCAAPSGEAASRGQPVPAWPGGKRYCVVLTHDVDTQHGIRAMERVWNIESSYGLASSWNIVGRLFEGNERAIDRLAKDGCEIGLHGDDHRLRMPYLPAGAIIGRIAKYKKFLETYRIQGFRSPYYLRSPALLSAVSRLFVYDSSIPDVDTFSLCVDRGGCCSVLPFRIGTLVELPVTLPYEIVLHMGVRPRGLNAFWREKIEWIKSAGGMILVNTHPEPSYLLEPDVSRAYGELLAALAGDGSAWYALPGEVAGWWAGAGVKGKGKGAS